MREYKPECWWEKGCFSLKRKGAVIPFWFYYIWPNESGFDCLRTLGFFTVSVRMEYSCRAIFLVAEKRNQA